MRADAYLVDKPDAILTRREVVVSIRIAESRRTDGAILIARFRSLFQTRARAEVVRFRARNRSLSVAAQFVITLLKHPHLAPISRLKNTKADVALVFHR